MKLKRFAAVLLVLTTVLSNTAFADTVVLADRPFGQTVSNGTVTGGSQAGSTGGPGSTSAAGSTGIAGTPGAGPGAAVGNNTAPAGTGSGNRISADGPSATTESKGNVESGSAEISVDSKIEKPVISSEAAVLIEASTGQVLYEKNATMTLYPASTTKLMTALLTAEKFGLNDTVSFSASATQGLEAGAVTASMTAGDTMTVRDALHALLLRSACEVANALGENVAGSEAAFAALMNQRAAALGCKNTSFQNASGLNSANHTSCAYDMALIARAAMANQTVLQVLQTKTYTLPASKKRGSLSITSTNKMLFPANAEYYPGIVAGKTGYTSKAGSTLAEAADVDGHRLIAVVMKSQGQHFNDAKKLFDYGRALIENRGAGTVSPENQGKWEQTAAGWKFRKPDGSYAVSEWVDIGDSEYYFSSDSIMATGWKKFSNGAWYYFDTEKGAMVHDKWVSTDGKKYYYLQSNGVMATNTVVAGKYRVDANGVYVEKVG